MPLPSTQLPSSRLAPDTLAPSRLAGVPFGDAGWTPLAPAGLKFWMPGSNLRLFWQEDLTAVAQTRVTADGQSVGQIIDPSPAAHRITAAGSTRRTVLAADGGRRSYLTFNGSTSCYVVENGKGAFRNVHCGGAFSWCFWIKVAADGVAYQILDSNQGSGSKVGLYLQRTTANKLECFIAKGSSVVDAVTAATLTVADGWTPVIITSDGSTLSIKIGLKATETFAQAAGAAAGTDSTNDLTIGALSVAFTQPLSGGLSDLIYCDQVMSANEQAAFRAYNPARADVYVTPQKQTWYDFSDVASLWQDTARSTAVAANNDPIRTADNKTGLQYKRQAVAPADGNRPLWKSADQNGLGDALFDAVDDHFALDQQWEKGGSQTLFLVVKHLLSTTRSDLLSNGGTDALVVTGSAYSVNASWYNKSYWAVHFATATPDVADLVNLVEDWNILCLVRDGASFRVVTNAGLTTDPHCDTAYTQVAQWAPSFLGKAQSGGVYPNAKIAELRRYPVVLNAGDLEAEFQALATKWGVSNVR